MAHKVSPVGAMPNQEMAPKRSSVPDVQPGAKLSISRLLRLNTEALNTSGESAVKLNNFEDEYQKIPDNLRKDWESFVQSPCSNVSSAYCTLSGISTTPDYNFEQYTHGSATKAAFTDSGYASVSRPEHKQSYFDLRPLATPVSEEEDMEDGSNTNLGFSSAFASDLFQDLEHTADISRHQDKIQDSLPGLLKAFSTRFRAVSETKTEHDSIDLVLQNRQYVCPFLRLALVIKHSHSRWFGYFQCGFADCLFS